MNGQDTLLTASAQPDHERTFGTDSPRRNI
jgi:hypothetical protein